MSTAVTEQRTFVRRLKNGDEVAYLITFIFAASILVITGMLLYELYTGSELARQKFGFGFLTGTTWDPVALDFGALPFVYGTIVTSVIALVLGVPLGVGAAIFLAELAPVRISDGLTFLIELLAAVPSVIYGLLAIFTLVPAMREYVMPFLETTLGFIPLFQGPAYGVSFLAAGVILALMILPFIISISREVLLAVPREQREAALALGATRWEMAWHVVVPHAKAGILGSVFLALARALGETMAVTMVIGNDPKIHASLFAPGYSIAAVIANEFSEATSPLYVSALIELGLVLFGITIIVNAVARLLILATFRAEKGRLMSRLAWRKLVNVVMFAITGVCTLIAASILFFILGYLVWQGGSALTLSFFTELPKPVGETGGGFANAIVGSAKLLALASLFGIPIGFIGGVYLAEFGGKTPAFIVRYTTDLLNGVPSIVMGIFAYAVIVLPMKHFSTLAGGIALGVMMIPIAVRSTEEFLRAVPQNLREAALALGASKWRAVTTVVIPAAMRGIITGIMLDIARVAGETAPLLFTAFNNRFWSPGLNQPTASLPVMIYTYAIAPYEDWHQQAWAGGLVLLSLVLVANIAARFVFPHKAHSQ